MSPRVKSLQQELVKTIPRIPNNRETLAALSAKGVGELIVYFLCWRLRFVEPRPRVVEIEPAATTDPRWPTRSEDVEALLGRATAGDDLTPWLSLSAYTRAFSLAATQPGSDVDRWEDKDFLLFIMGLHHFHLGQTLEKKGHAKRTDEIIFAEVSREKFVVVALTDHDVFANNSDGSLTSERERLWELFDARRSAGVEPGAVMLSGGYGGLGISTSGHPTFLVMLAQKYAKIIRDIDPKLDDTTYLASLYPDGSAKKPKLSWRFKHLDLVICDDANHRYFVMSKGPV